MVFDGRSGLQPGCSIYNLVKKMSLQQPLKKLFCLHVFIIVLSNYAVQIPCTVLGVETTMGTFTYPFIFLTTDLTVRLYGSEPARRVIFIAMIPALIISYFVGTLFAHGSYQGFGALAVFSIFVFRIAAASFSAYVVGQLADILVFSRLRRMRQWWPAPAASSVVGNALDTFVFYFIAFWHTTDAYMASHWIPLSIVDYVVKVIASLALFVPLYGIILSFLAKYVFKRPLTAVQLP